MVGRRNELSLYDGHQISRRVNLSTYMYRSYSVIYTIEKDKNNNLWLGINDEESCATIHKKTFFSHVDLDVDNLDIRVFYEDEDGTMLIGSEIGLYTYSKGTINKIAMNSWKTGHLQFLP